MNLSPNHRRNLSRILPFGIFWLIFACSYSLLEKGLLGDLSYYPSTGNPYNFETTPVFLLVAFVGGLIVGTIEILYLSKRFGKWNLFQKIFFKATVYLILVASSLLLIAAIMNAHQLGTSFYHPVVISNVAQFFGNFAFLSTMIFTGLMILISLFYAEVSENIGQQVLINFLTGKYHHPIQENRIFLFVDMKSSTAIAEKVGHIKYFKMLRQYYDHLSDPVVEYMGEIYQYVGDEMIVCWDLNKGLNNGNCLKCYFAMKEAIKTHAQTYIEQYGLTPSFKAGIHFGPVTTGEIGQIKKAIMYTGDVLNTTARIRSLCNELNQEILISEQLVQHLKINAQWTFEPMGEHQLRGRNQHITLYSVSKKINGFK